MERDEQLLHLARTLKELHRQEKIPAPRRHVQTRARLVGAFGEMILTVFDTRLGWLGVGLTDRGIAALQLPRPTRAQALRALQCDFPNSVVAESVPAEVMRELREYTEGRRHRFDLPLDLSSIGPFQRAVLQAAKGIPFGETRSYAWIARAIGKPRAARAVGRALGANPIPIILPCHRVVGSDGSLHGYGGGLPLKKKLLQLEGALA